MALSSNLYGYHSYIRLETLLWFDNGCFYSLEWTTGLDSWNDIKIPINLNDEVIEAKM